MEALLATSAVISSKSGSPSIFKSKPKETMVTSKILKYLIQTIIQYPSNIQKTFIFSIPSKNQIVTSPWILWVHHEPPMKPQGTPWHLGLQKADGWGYPQFSSIYRWMFHEIIHPAIGVPTF